MTWTFDETNIGTTTANERLNSVRTLIQDTDCDSRLLQDEEILFYVGQTSNDVYLAASMAADALAARYARYGDTSLDDGGISVDFKDVAEGYRLLSTQMRKASQQFGSGGIGMPRAGGVSRASATDVYQNTDRIDPSFRQGQFRNPPGIGSDDEDDRIR